MEFADCEEIGFSSSSSSSSNLLCLCRICHEEEEQSTTSMESPCACSGTLKFAHRGCIQRWCDEKGSTICEICLQKFEPSYTVTSLPALPHMIEVVITIRGSLEAARLSHDLQAPAMAPVTGNRQEPEHAQCFLASNRSKSCVQSVASMFVIMFLLRHVVAVILDGNYHYSSKIFFVSVDDLSIYSNCVLNYLNIKSSDKPQLLAQVFLLRAVGVFLPFYLMIQLIAIIRIAKRDQQLHERDGESEDDIEEQ